MCQLRCPLRVTATASLATPFPPVSDDAALCSAFSFARQQALGARRARCSGPAEHPGRRSNTTQTDKTTDRLCLTLRQHFFFPLLVTEKNKRTNFVRNTNQINEGGGEGGKKNLTTHYPAQLPLHNARIGGIFLPLLRREEHVGALAPGSTLFAGEPHRVRPPLRAAPRRTRRGGSGHSTPRRRDKLDNLNTLRCPPCLAAAGAAPTNQRAHLRRGHGEARSQRGHGAAAPARGAQPFGHLIENKIFFLFFFNIFWPLSFFFS